MRKTIVLTTDVWALAGREREEENQEYHDQEEEAREPVKEQTTQTKALIVLPEQVQEETIIVDAVPPAPPTPRISLKTSLLLVASTILITSLVILLVRSLLVPPAAATITITPETKNVTKTVRLSAADIHARALPDTTISEKTTIPTTGHGHMDTTRAGGSVIFYNASLYPQTVPAGTILNTASGIQIETDQAAVIPAGSLAQNGSVTVSAHAREPGTQGNIPAGSIQGACCLFYVLVSNNAFSGGTDARDFPAVAKEDIDTSSTNLLNEAKTTITKELHGVLTETEHLIDPPTCTHTIQTDHQAGEEATMVTIIIAYTCHATAYNTVRFQERTTPLLCRDLESHYTAWGSPKATITQEANAFTLHLTGMCRYRFSSDELHLLQKQLAGLSLEGAYKKLRAHQGIAQARISLSAGERDLPTDSDQIMIQLNAA